MSAMSINTTNTTSTWNGPICPTCGLRYLGGCHACSWDDLQRRIEELRTAQDRLTRGPVKTSEFPMIRDTSGCPCRPENGGSGVCGCILSSPTVTC